MKNLLKIILGLTGFLLPLHGGITVFLPDEFRWWKEILLGILLLLVFWYDGKRIRDLIQKKSADFFTQVLKNWSHSELIAKCLLGFGGILFLINTDKETALIALRYLLLFPFVFLVIRRIRHFQSDEKGIPTLFDHFSHHFVFGCILSILFGTWVKYGGGELFVQNFYSNTISSWVPGQTLQIWHETAGFIRMQGLSSGPIEFSHLLVGALAILQTLWFRKPVKLIIGAALLFGIYQSASRAAMIGAIIILGFFAFDMMTSEIKARFQKNRRIFYTGIIALLGIAIIGINFLLTDKNFTQKIYERAGTSDHITRPIEAFKIGLKSPFLGNLGKLGPAARAKNLATKNDDKAPIAENIFADYFAQMGLIGFALMAGLWLCIWKEIPKKFRGFFLASFVMVNLATVFDMTPVALSFGILLAFMTSSGTNQSD